MSRGRTPMEAEERKNCGTHIRFNDYERRLMDKYYAELGFESRSDLIRSATLDYIRRNVKGEK